jgi:hypothetical protein
MGIMKRYSTRSLGWILAGGLLLGALFQACSVDHGLGPTTQGIRGTVHFEGTWPDSILEVRVVVFGSYPVESFLDLAGYSGSLPLGCDSCDYSVVLPAGEYGFVAAACRSKANWDASCLLGFYHAPGSPQVPESIVVGAGVFTPGADIMVDFSGFSGDAAILPVRVGPVLKDPGV